LVTINPAKQLKIDKFVGSLEPKKDADFVIWDGEPLSIYSKVEETWIDGIRYFSKTENKILEERDEQLRKDIIQKILSIKGGTGTNTSKSTSSKMYHQGHNCDILDNTGVYNE
jgi:adenine deaminase